MGAWGKPIKAMYPFLFAILNNRHPLDREISHYMVVVAESTRFWLADNCCWVEDLSLPAGRTMDPGVEQAVSYHRFTTEKEARTFIRQWWIEHPVE